MSMLEMHSLHGYILGMNLATFDLNLLIVFDALMQERSVTRAGQRIGLSQPAMSHALNRLRYLLKDELFVRTPEGMMPTPRAEHLALPLRHALNEMQLALEPEAFVPAEAERSFAVAVNNYAAVVLVPALVAAVSKAAPRVRLDLRPSGTIDVLEQLDRGELDLAIVAEAPAAERIGSATLFTDPFVSVMRRDHPAARRRPTAASLARLPHLEISSVGDDTRFIDEWLAERGLERRNAARAPFLSAAAILSQSDMVAVLGRRVAQVFVRNNPLRLRDLPYASPTVGTTMAWHRRFDGQPAHRWLRGAVQEANRAL
jgi:DNA-binding transcriptional LysR family regulator